MKVALIIDTWFPTIGGGQINAFEISKRLTRQDVSIDVITRNTGTDNFKLPANLKVIKLGQKAKPFDYFSKVVFLFNAYLYIRKRDYDLVHAHAFLPGITARLLSIFIGIPSIFTIHGTSIGTGLNNTLKEWVEKFILTQTLYSSQITVSQDFFKIKNINKNIVYIPNGVETSTFNKVASPSVPKTLIFVGRLTPHKNLETLLKSIFIVKEEIPNIQLTIVGDGPQQELLKKITKDLGLTKNVLFQGEIHGTELIKLYKSSKAFLLPSIYEGQPITMLEAWAAKIPVIVTASGDCPYLVKDGVNGYLIKNPKDFLEIASQIKKALAVKDLQRMGQNGYNLVAKNFSWDKSAKKTLEVYESLTKAKN